MKRGRFALYGMAILTLMVVLVGLRLRGATDLESHAQVPVMSVSLTRAQAAIHPLYVRATGQVMAWQEAIIGSEANGLRLTDVKVNVGDSVRQGQILATFDADIVDADLAESVAVVAEAETAVVEADANFRRTKDLALSGAMSAQEVGAYESSANVARARLAAARAVKQRNRLRLAQTRVRAPSDGIITSRIATVGAVLPSGQELFRMIKDGRLEWRAEVSATDLQRLRPGATSRIEIEGRPPVTGTLRMLGPTIDPQTLSGLAYIDLPAGADVRAGAFLAGNIELGDAPAVTLPLSAVLLRDGFHHVMRVGASSEVRVQKVAVGRRIGDRIEITEGVSPSQEVIASGLSFLSEGDIVQIVERDADNGPQEAATWNRAVPVGGDA